MKHWHVSLLCLASAALLAACSSDSETTSPTPTAHLAATVEPNFVSDWDGFAHLQIDMDGCVYRMQEDERAMPTVVDDYHPGIFTFRLPLEDCVHLFQGQEASVPRNGVIQSNKAAMYYIDRPTTGGVMTLLEDQNHVVDAELGPVVVSGDDAASYDPSIHPETARARVTGLLEVECLFSVEQAFCDQVSSGIAP